MNTSLIQRTYVILIYIYIYVFPVFEINGSWDISGILP